MRTYEIVIIANPELDEESLNGIIEKVSSWITDGGGEIEKVDHWGKRKLAYQIQKQREGDYYLITAKMKPGAVKEFNSNIKYVENIIRSMVSLVEEKKIENRQEPIQE
jgi:small subunit ribosomal protein S6